MPDAPAPEQLPTDLHYVDDNQPGFSRRKLRGAFAYFDLAGQPIRDLDEIKRINALAIPPAAMHGAASNTVTTRAGAKSATRTNTRDCSSSAFCCPKYASKSTTTWPTPSLIETKSWPWSFPCSTPH
jgi:hypothetical protein